MGRPLPVAGAGTICCTCCSLEELQRSLVGLWSIEVERHDWLRHLQEDSAIGMSASELSETLLAFGHVLKLGQ